MVTGSFVSAARGGVNTNWAIARPPGQTKPLRPVIALHGKGSDASTVMAGGVEQGLAQAVNAGLPPFAVVAVDGGGSYWHKRASGEDSGAMVLNELIPMLGSQNLDTSRLAFLGWSMGGYGALLLGGRLGPGAHRGDLRGEPGVVAVVRCGRPRRIRRVRRLRGELGVRNARFGVDPDPGGLRRQRPVLRRRQSSSSLNCPTRRRAVSRPAGTTGSSGARSCRPS